jgi:DNA-binding transcriptional LysR family regulator
MIDLDLRKLRYFLAVADELNYARAAQTLHIAQPVLSRQITALERELGVELFERSKQGTRLTEAGELLREDARALLSSAGALKRRARIAGRAGKEFTVGFMPGIIVTPAVQRLELEFPGLRVGVVRTAWNDQVEMVHDGRVDVSFARPPFPRRGLTLVPLFTEPRVVALPAAHPLAARQTVPLAELAALPLLQDPDAVPEWRDAQARLHPGALAIDRAHLPIVHTVEEKLEHVAAERGIVIFPQSTAAFYTRPDIAYRPVPDLPPGEVALAYAARRHSAELDAMVRIACELYAATPAPATRFPLTASG